MTNGPVIAVPAAANAADAVVVGAGPAGLSAAIELRPSSVENLCPSSYNALPPQDYV